MAKQSALDKAITALREKRNVLDLAIAELEAQMKTANWKPAVRGKRAIITTSRGGDSVSYTEQK